MSVVKILKHPPNTGGPFGPGDLIPFTIPQGLTYDLERSRLQYKIQVTCPEAGPVSFGDNIKPSTPDILFSNAYFNSVNEGLIDQSPQHKIRKCNEYEYEKNWVEKNCDSTWGYEGNYDSYFNFNTVLFAGAPGQPGPIKLITHPLNRFFERSVAPYVAKSTTDLRFELDPDQNSYKFIKFNEQSGKLKEGIDACNNETADGTGNVAVLTITDGTAYNTADADVARDQYKAGSLVLVSYVDATVAKQVIGKLDDNPDVACTSLGGHILLTFDPELTVGAANVNITNIQAQAYDPTQMIQLSPAITLDATSQIDDAQPFPTLTLNSAYPSPDVVPVKAGGVYAFRCSTSQFKVLPAYPAGGGVIKTILLHVRSVTWVDDATPPTFDIYENPVFDAPANSNLVSGHLYDPNYTGLPVADASYQITDVNLVLYTISDIPKQIANSYLMPIVQTFNYMGGSRLSMNIDLRPNCKLVCLYTPIDQSSLSVLDNATRYRLQLDNKDTTTRDIKLLSNEYHYISLLSNYGAVRDISRIKADPNLYLNADGTKIVSLFLLAQLVNGNQRLHIDLYADHHNMSAKIIYVFQYLEMNL